MSDTSAANAIRARLRRVVAKRKKLTEELDAQRDQIIRDGLAAGIRAEDLAADAGFAGRARIYQIRDNRR